MSSRKVPVAEPDITREDLAEMVKVLNTGWISGISPVVEEFERAFADAHDCAHGVASGSGTQALHLALAAAGIKKGDEVIMPDFTMIACPNAVSYLGAKPVFVDAHPYSWNINPDLIEEKITKKTRAIMPVHIYGNPCQMDKIKTIADKHGLKVIEDCAEAHGANFKGEKVGSMGDAGIFSFYANKIITTGEGGMLITNDAKLAKEARWLRAHAFGRGGKHFWHEKLGYGYRMSGLQAALGLSQLNRISFYVDRHRHNAQLYMNLMRALENSGKIGYVSTQVNCKNVYWMFSITINETVFGLNRDEIMTLLAQSGIETRTMFYPMHIQPPYKIYYDKGPHVYKDEDFPVSSRLCRTGMNLPSGNTLTPDKIYWICEKMREYAGDLEKIKDKEKYLRDKIKIVSSSELKKNDRDV